MMSYDKPKIMGIVNVTPDSFSGDGLTFVSEALKHAYELIDAGADIIDIGGESTRPGFTHVSEEDEVMRAIPIINQLSHTSDVTISIDTMKTYVAEVAIDAGADIINDVNALRTPGMMHLAASKGVPVIIVHTNGTPETTHKHVMGTDYKNDIARFLKERIKSATEEGVKELIIDPGIGFGKTPEQNMDICEHAGDYSFGYPVLIGASRKRFISNYYEDVEQGSIDVHLKAIKSGANIVRVHNVKQMADAIKRSEE